MSISLSFGLQLGNKSIGNDGDDMPLYVAVSGDSFTRPADTTAYAAGDQVANSTTQGSVVALTFANAARVSGGAGYITRVFMSKSGTGVTNAQFRIYFWNASPTLFADNAAMALAWADRAKSLGYVDIVLTTEGSGGDTAVGVVDSCRLPFVASATTIYGTIAARSAYTPGNAEQFRVELGIEQS